MEEKNENTRRRFIKTTGTGIAALTFGGVLPGFSAKSYASIIGANERIRVAMMGVNARGLALATNYSLQPNCEVAYVCDVDSRAAAKCVDVVEQNQKKRPVTQPDFRKALEDKNVDVLVIAAPDHWHAPAAILASQAGKHVYLEKPCSHNPNEGELLIAAAKKYKNVIQMGNQRRSYPNVMAAINELKAGVIGRPYFAKGWYVNNRPSIGIGKKMAVPSWLNFDLWQGPAPRVDYKDNMLHYNWHWFWHWGTGESLNNGTHMIDLARWGLGVTFPTKVSSSGGRYRYKDDQETPDTQVINLEFDNNTAISWEGRSCNGRLLESSTVGVIFYGDNGSVQIDGDSYKVSDLTGKVIKEVKSNIANVTTSLTNPSQALDALHIQNFFDGIKKGTALNSDILGGYPSTLLVQLGNISQRCGSSLNINPKTGHIIDNKEAMKYWGRTYQPGWEPKV